MKRFKNNETIEVLGAWCERNDRTRKEANAKGWCVCGRRLTTLSLL